LFSKEDLFVAEGTNLYNLFRYLHIMEAFIGTWKVDLSQTQGIDSLAEAFGWDADKKDKVSKLAYTMVLESDGSDGIKGSLDYGFAKHDYQFKLGEAFDWQTFEGTKMKLLITITDGVWNEAYSTPEGFPAVVWRMKREVAGDKMNVTSTFEGKPDAKCIQTLNKL